jgi:hypothetical protein
MGTSFVDVYNRFLGKITDDMYMELTPEDTIKDLRTLLIDAIPGFEFPRKHLDEYTIETLVIDEDLVDEGDFIIGVVWDELDDGEYPQAQVLVERSQFDEELTSEEINILAILMMNAWLQRQVTSIENTRMKYSGTDFKFTSQANHLAKLQALLGETQRQSHHMQRLYKRRRTDPETGLIESNWGNQVGYGVYYDVRKKLKTNDRHEGEDDPTSDLDGYDWIIYDGGEQI